MIVCRILACLPRLMRRGYLCVLQQVVFFLWVGSAYELLLRIPARLPSCHPRFCFTVPRCTSVPTLRYHDGDGHENVAYKAKPCVLSNSIAIIRIRLLCQMQPNYSGAEFLPVSLSSQRERKFRLRSFSFKS